MPMEKTDIGLTYFDQFALTVNIKQLVWREMLM